MLQFKHCILQIQCLNKYNPNSKKVTVKKVTKNTLKLFANLRNFNVFEIKHTNSLNLELYH